MDPPLDPSEEECHRILDEAFRALVASTPSPPSLVLDVSDANFDKRTTAPRIQIKFAALRLKALALSEKGLIG